MKILREVLGAVVFCSAFVGFLSASVGDWVKAAMVTSDDWKEAYVPTSIAELKRNDGVYLGIADLHVPGYVSAEEGKSGIKVVCKKPEAGGTKIQIAQGDQLKLKKAFEVLRQDNISNLNFGDELMFVSAHSVAKVGDLAQFILLDENSFQVQLTKNQAIVDVQKTNAGVCAKITKQSVVGFADDSKVSGEGGQRVHSYLTILAQYTDDQIKAMKQDELVALLQRMIKYSPFKSYFIEEGIKKTSITKPITKEAIGANIQSRIDMNNKPKSAREVLESFNSLTADALTEIKNSWLTIQDMMQFEIDRAETFGDAVYPWYSSVNPKDQTLRILTQLDEDCGYNALWSAACLINSKYDMLGKRKRFMEYLRQAKNHAISDQFQKNRLDTINLEIIGAQNDAERLQAEGDRVTKVWLDSENLRGFQALAQLNAQEVMFIFENVIKKITEFSDISEEQFGIVNVKAGGNQVTPIGVNYPILNKFLRQDKRIAFLVNFGGGHWMTICFYKSQRKIEYIIANSTAAPASDYKWIAQAIVNQLKL